MVERHLAKVNVASSNLVFRSITGPKRFLLGFYFTRKDKFGDKMSENNILKERKKVRPAEKKSKKTTKVTVNYQVLRGFLLCFGCFLFLTSFIFEQPASIVILALAFVSVSGCIFYEAVKKGKEGNYFNTELLITICGILVFVMGNFYQGIWMMILVNGERMLTEHLFQEKPKICDLYQHIKSRTYHVMVERQSQFVKATRLKKGDYVELFSGELIPVDGYIKAGSGTISTRDITGESKMIAVHAKDEVLSGYTLLSGNVIVEARGGIEEGTVGKMNHNFEAVAAENTALETKVKRYTDWYTCAILLIGMAYVLVKYFAFQDFTVLKAGIPLLLVICCTDFVRQFLQKGYLTIVYRCGEKGIVIKEKRFVEQTLFLKNIFFRKQGVLTDNTPELVAVHPASGVTKQELLGFVAFAQYKADNAISRIVLHENGRKVDTTEITQFRQLAGNGAMVKLANGMEVITGNARILQDFNITVGVDDSDAKLCVAINNTYVGYLQFHYPAKRDLKQCMDSLRFAGVKHLAVLSKDEESAAKEIAGKAGIDDCYYELTQETMMQIVDQFKGRSLGISFGNAGIGYPEKCAELVYGGFDYDRDGIGGLIIVDDILAVLSYYNIIRDARAMFLQDIFIDLVLKIIIIALFFNFVAYPWIGVALLMGIDLLTKFNHFWFFKKI